MKRNDHATKYLIDSTHYGYTAGVPGVRQPSIITADALNNFQEEISRAIEDADVALDGSSYRQLSQVSIARAELGAYFRMPAMADIDGGGAHVWYGAAANYLGLLVVVGEGGKIRTSQYGSGTWTSRTAGSAYASTFYGVLWNGTYFVAWGAGGEIQTSPDGVTWTRRHTGGSDIFGAAYSDGGRIIAVVNDGAGGALYSDDLGLTWGSLSAMPSTAKSITVDGTTWITASLSPQEVLRSTDGSTFSTVDLSGLIGASEYVSFVSCAETGQGFVAGVYDSGAGTMQRLIGSWDGLTWTSLYDTGNTDSRVFARGRSLALLIPAAGTIVGVRSYGVGTGGHLLLPDQGDVAAAHFVRMNGCGCWVRAGISAEAGYLSVSELVPR